MEPNIFKIFIKNFFKKLADTQYNKETGFEIEVLKKVNFITLFFETTSLRNINNLQWQLDFIFKEVDYGYLNQYKREIYLLLSELYIIAGDSFKRVLNDRINEYLNKAFDVSLFLKAVDLNIIIPDKNLLNLFSDSLWDLELNDDLNWCIINFVIFSKSDFKDIMKCIKGINKQYTFLVERENYDYKNNPFEIKWLYLLTNEQLEGFNGEFYEFIQNKIKEQILITNFREKKLIELYFGHFAS